MDATLLKRTRVLNDKPVTHGPVVYFMSRDNRVEDNWALIYAKLRAEELHQPLLVVYNLVPGFLGGGVRQWDFKVRGIKEVAESLAKLAIPFYLLLDKSGKESETLLAAFMKEHGVGLIVTDFSPLRAMRLWTESVAKHCAVSVVEVDAHNIVPVWVASPKQEFGAYTLRPKLHKLLPEFLVEFPKVAKQKRVYEKALPTIDWEAILAFPTLDTSVEKVTWITPGAKAGKKILTTFIEKKLAEYNEKRNDPLAGAQSDLSPYLHYGQIAPQRVALEVLKDSGLSHIEHILSSTHNGASGKHGNHAAYLEELIVRRELSDNFCFYNSAYDSEEGFPSWARLSHVAHKNDTRDFVYTKEEFEKAETHEPLWNAAQREMVKTGKLHGYMRMYWAKKILEWTPTVEEAMEIAIYLNDKYELDGRDPNGYAGIAWSIGGVHDRAWFSRPIFGQIRYMNASGCKSKFNTKAYIEKWLGTSTLPL